MKLLALGLSVVVVSFAAACGSDSPSKSAAPPTTAASAPSAAGSAPSAAGSGTTLTGTVGKDDAFKIALLDSSGAPVTTLKAGSYEIKVKDLSKIHDFHLSGPGVEEKTSVSEVQDVTWKVALTPGTYTFKCDPHSDSMSGTFTVT